MIMLARSPHDRAGPHRHAGGVRGAAGRGVPAQGRADAARLARRSSASPARIVTSVLLWDRNRVGFGVIVLDNYALFFNITICAIGLLTILLSVGTAERDHLPQGEYYALMLFSIVGMMLMGSTRDLLVIFLALEIMSLGVYVMTGLKRTERGRRGGGVQVLRARRVFERVLPLRHRARLRGDRHDQARRARHAGRQLGARPERPARARDGPAARRLRLQGVGGAVPHVDARRLSGRADARDRLHVHRRQGGGVRGLRPRVPVGARAAAAMPRRRHGIAWVPCSRHRRPDDDSRHGRRRGADERQTHARVFEHRARRVSARRARRRELGGKAAILFYLVAYAVTNLGAFGVLAALSTTDRPHDDVRDFAGLWHERPGLAALLTVFLLSLGGFPPTVGFIAKWYIFNAAVQENLIALAVARRADERRLRLLLPADRRADVHDRRNRARPPAARCPSLRLAGMLLALARRVLPRRPARPAALDRRRLGEVDLLTLDGVAVLRSIIARSIDRSM